MCVDNVFQVEIEVIGEGAIEVETGLEEVVNTAKSSEEGSDDSALALLADITSKYQHGESTLHIIKKDHVMEEVSWGVLEQTLQLIQSESSSQGGINLPSPCLGLSSAGSGVSRGSNGCLQSTWERWGRRGPDFPGGQHVPVQQMWT